MALNLIMVFGGVIFAVLFAFLMFVFIIVMASFFRKEKEMDHEPEVSVIIPCYNEEKNIKGCLDAVYSLDYPKSKIEVIVVDDGSTDNTLKILKECRKKNSKIVILEGKHEGKSASLNMGVKKAKKGIIFTIDADTEVDNGSLKKLVRPFARPDVGATNGSCIARNRHSMLEVFQTVEYHYNNLIRKSFSILFRNGIWFFGAFACYKKDVLKKIGYFKKDTMNEDMDVALEIYRGGYKTINVYDALSYTLVPDTYLRFFRQRVRWWAGVLQALHKNKGLFARGSNASILFLFINQYWWSFYAIVSLPIIIYQIFYWLPYNMADFSSLFMYLFRWFSFLGPLNVLYKIPEWGISLYSIFGVLSGIISAILIVISLYTFKDRLTIKNAIGVFFYFPYTIILNTITLISLIKLIFLKKKHFSY
ncbi:hypothetical protein COV19_06350 [Candidatus Woesearchaeota archaeon CG10_big_fil_rev_8_21_14_0_10_44_13]|nr:MAG: hypothetical protein COV19_06350 [Candidatus Woesearchaeota archaeon CG10_big_fil_rev_8_21_14_0_10_44_13]